MSRLYNSASYYFNNSSTDFSYASDEWRVNKAPSGTLLLGTRKLGILGTISATAVEFEKPIPEFHKLCKSQLSALGIAVYKPKTLKYAGHDWQLHNKLFRGETPKIITSNTIEFFEPPKVRVLDRKVKKALMQRIAEISSVLKTMHLLHTSVQDVRATVHKLIPNFTYMHLIDAIKTDTDPVVTAMKILSNNSPYMEVQRAANNIQAKLRSPTFIEKVLSTPGMFCAVHYEAI